MTIRSTILAAPIVLAAFGLAQAGDLQPGQAQSIDLGDVSGVAYYTAEADGFRVVTTLASERGTPIRSVAVLEPGQAVIVSTPGELGTDAVEVEIRRDADTVSVQNAAQLIN